MTELTTSICRIESADTHIIRHRILRPNQDLSDSIYPLDDAPQTLHAGCFMAGDLVGIASVFNELKIKDASVQGTKIASDQEPPPEWRLRGLAVVQTARGMGVGRLLINAVIDHASLYQKDGTIWCKVRLDAIDYLHKYGFEASGAVFENESLGPHRIMSRDLPG
ncbi:MAG: GNAT family N-acetyltransferase [Pseudomonadota bacterium]